MKKEIFTKLFLLILLFFVIQGTGCGTARSVYKLSAETAKAVSEKIIPAQKPILRKKVLLSPVIDQAGIKRDKAVQIIDTLLNLLKKDKSLLVTVADTATPSRAKIRSPQFGVVTDPMLTKKAEELGMNVLITLTLNPFEVTTKKAGIWPFRKIKEEVEISMSLNAMDVINGTLFLTNLEARKIRTDREITEEGENRLDSSRRDIDDKALDKALNPILKNLSSQIIDALRYQPWAGKIRVEGDRAVRISGGKDIGITEGSVFNVYGGGESIRSVSGRAYSFLGTKMGELKAEKVMRDYSLAVPMKDQQFKDGQVIKLRR